METVNVGVMIESEKLSAELVLLYVRIEFYIHVYSYAVLSDAVFLEVAINQIWSDSSFIFLWCGS